MGIFGAQVGRWATSLGYLIHKTHRSIHQSRFDGALGLSEARLHLALSASGLQLTFGWRDGWRLPMLRHGKVRTSLGICLALGWRIGWRLIGALVGAHHTGRRANQIYR